MMKKTICLFLFVCLVIQAQAEEKKKTNTNMTHNNSTVVIGNVEPEDETTTSENTNMICTSVTAPGPVAIVDNATVFSVAGFADNLSIDDVNVTLNINHTWVSDMNIVLTSRSGTTANIISAQCGADDNVDAVFDDAGVALACAGGPPTITGTVIPEEAFSVFNGEESAGDWTLSVEDTAAGDNGSINDFTIEVCGDCVVTTVDPLVLTSPLDGQGGVVIANLAWDALTGVGLYNLQIATDAGFASIVEDVNVGTNSYAFANAMAGTTYYWRVIAVNGCVTNAQFSETFSFTTATTSCDPVVLATDTPVNIQDNQTVTSTLTFANTLNISDVNVTIDISHTWVSDMDITLTSPAGTIVTLVSGACGADNDIDAIFDDAGAAIACGGTPTISGTVAPQQPLAAFNGEGSAGDWILSVTDNAGGDQGTINIFGVEICGALDTDNDTIADSGDNCPTVANTDQADNDGDGFGDLCDDDDDNDGVLDINDNCQFTVNPDQTDWDQDGIGNDCDDNTDIAITPGNGFTPNGDGNNDQWYVRNIWFYPNSVIKVYNRWGNLVFEANGYDNTWNGESSEGGSGTLPAGSYYFTIEPNNPTFGTIGVTPITGWTYINY
ncbi:MAG: proprotein convertase P-domain-containing protein [Flavobacteriaceae bacterium]|nr:proprotein convertase P-domain-containing protein [Flavobacteriaceae bacterium]